MKPKNILKNVTEYRTIDINTEKRMEIKKSFRIANEAVSEYLVDRKYETKPIIAASIGSYGAFLSNGSEYTGNYNTTVSNLREFHYEKIKILKDEGAELFACETIPSFDEATVLRDIC